MVKNSHTGFSLIELLVVIVVIGILAGIAMQSMTATVGDIRRIGTEREMAMLAAAIVGDPNQTQNNRRSDFGYVGDVGAFPSSLQALYQNPGGYATWRGPYLPAGFAEDSVGFKLDEWGSPYAYSGGIVIASTGGGTPLVQKLADATTDYLLNTIEGTIMDAGNQPPGTDYADSIEVVISYPNGSGSTTSKTYNPDSSGFFALDSIPAGTHRLRLIYTPNIDTLTRYLTVLPRHKSQPMYRFASAYFGGGGGGGSAPGSEILRPRGGGSATELSGENCSTNWQCVDEPASDGDGTYVKGAGSLWLMDTYETADHTVGSGTIDSIVVYIKAKGDGGGMKARTAIRIGGGDYTGSSNNTTASYVDYWTTYLTNPSTSSSWTWVDIDNLEIGVELKKVAFNTQVWVEVFYTP